MTRARVLVLREKQQEVLPRCEELYRRFFPDTSLDDSEDDDAFDTPLGAIISTLQEAERVFEIKISTKFFKEYADPLNLAADVALALLDKNPPDTKPPWNSPWDVD